MNIFREGRDEIFLILRFFFQKKRKRNAFQSLKNIEGNKKKKRKRKKTICKRKAF